METALLLVRLVLLGFSLWSLVRAGLIAVGRAPEPAGGARPGGTPATPRRRIYRNLRNATVSAILALALGEIASGLALV